MGMLSDEKRNLIENSPFGRSDRTLYLLQRKYWVEIGISDADLKRWQQEYIKMVEKANKDADKYSESVEKVSRKCSKCKNTMTLVEVNTTPKNKIEEDGESMWCCDACAEYVVNAESASALLNTLLSELS
jgi:hypothetical protein